MIRNGYDELNLLRLILQSFKFQGYDLYPERKESGKPKTSWGRVLLGLEGTENIDKLKCERNVYKCILNSPLIKLMMGALKSSGCEIDIRRHISCELCDTSVSGGYDPVLNQVVVCQNIAKSEGMVQGVLAHEMIHMFDYCTSRSRIQFEQLHLLKQTLILDDLDFKNIDHLACTEIRAANLTHCSFMSAWSQGKYYNILSILLTYSNSLILGDASPFNIKQAHQNCVKTKALASVLAVRKVTHEQAIDAVERVFPKCYADLEPIGRRLRRNSNDMFKAYTEAPLYGYDVY